MAPTGTTITAARKAARKRPVAKTSDPAPATAVLPSLEDVPAAAASSTATPGADSPQHPSKAPRPSGPPTLRVVPSPAPEVGADDEQPADRGAAQPDPPIEVAPPRPAARRAAGGRATVPVWADVLMGTRSSSGAEPDRRD